MTNRARFQWFCMCASVVLFLSGVNPMRAQTQNATILGTVTDATGAAVAGASIQVVNSGTGVAQNTVTDNQGRYRVPDLLIGSYSVTAKMMGFQTAVHAGITLTVGAQSVVDFALQVGQQQQTVTVEGEVSQVETTTSSVSSLVDQTQMRDLPLNGRNFTQLVTLAPGVSKASTGSSFYGGGTNFSIAGSRAEGQAVLLDNTDVNDFWNHGTGSAAIGSSLGVEAVAEFQVLTNTYSAQFGGSGAVINAATRSGTNDFHGSAYGFIRNSAMDARNLFDVSKPPFRQNQFGGSLGGPIKKDKLFFFVNYEGLRNALGQTGRAFVPDANAHQGIVPVNGTPTNVGIASTTAPILALYPLPNGPEVLDAKGNPSGVALYNSVASKIQHENYILARGDWTLSDRDSIFFRYVSDRGYQSVPYAGSRIPLWGELDHTRNQYFTTEEKRVISPTLVNLIRFSFVRPVEDAAPAGEHTPLQFFPGLGREDGVVNPGSGISGIGANTLIPYALIQNKFWYADDVIWTKGAHSIKFGAQIGRIQSNIFAPFIIGGSYSFPNLQQFLAGKPSTFLGVAPDQGDATRDFREIDFAPYFQDDWKISPTLTLNLGVRWDYTTDAVGVRHPLNTIVHPPSVYPGNPSTGFTTVDHVFANNPNAKNFDPRFGFAWDPFKDHKTSVRGGFGIFHDQIAPRWYASGYYLAPPFSFGLQIAPPFPDPYPNYVPSGKTPTGVSILEGVNYQTSTAPYEIQYNLNVQREIAPNTVLTVGYVGSRGVHLTMQIDQNPPVPTVGADGKQVFGSINPKSGTVTPNPRMSPNFSYVNNGTTWGNSNYNALQVSVNRRLAQNLTAQVSYTWSRCLDEDSGSFGLEGAGNVTDPYNAHLDYGRCNFDIGQNLIVNSIYSLPFQGNRAVSGWQVSGIFTANSGAPFTVAEGFDQAGLQNSQARPNYVPGCQVMVQQLHEWYNPACFQIQPVGEMGTEGRNTFTSPGAWNLDFALLKNTNITERVGLQFRAEFFNIFNHPNWGPPVTSNFVQVPFTGSGTTNALAGTINSASVPRQIQFALKFTF